MRRDTQGAAGGALSEQRLTQLESALKKLEEDGEEDDDQLNRSSFWRLLSSPFGKDGFFSRFMHDVLDVKNSPDKDAANSGAEGSSEIVSGSLSKRMRNITQAMRSTLSVAILSAFVQAEAGAHCYPEWNQACNSYRADWVRVEEVDAHAAEPQFAAGMLGAGGDRAYQRSLPACAWVLPATATSPRVTSWR
ncbi:hypothetical protein [Pseudomonas borbori]|uniref:hypothetical protein n=1 Tax=Pseudomonas borbori TaxID=289003 RepID=UPI000B8774BF|nr:hypothetical protein [Pseudomonas borbori]